MSDETVLPTPAAADSKATRAAAVAPDSGAATDGSTLTDPDPNATNPDPGGTVVPAPRRLGARAAVPGYEILQELGRGGMGVVYLARQTKLNRTVALKMILSGGHAGPEELARFITEAEAVAQLQHPNIVQIFESGEHEGLPYFSLEYVGGGSLAQQVREQPLPPNAAARVVEQLARGVAYAHAHGIVHRDLKPENVLLADEREQGTGNREQAGGKSQPRSAGGKGPGSSLVPVPCSLFPKIADFGLAKRVELDADATRAPQTPGRGSSRTHTGAVIGTPSYMAPEQARGEVSRVGPAADVYALGAILYRVLTGRPPFQAATVPETLVQVTEQDPVAPTQLQPGLPRDLETICLKCLQKEPSRRYGSAQELANDLLRFLAHEPIVARPVGRLERTAKWVKRRPAVAALSAALVAVVALGFGLVTWKWLDERAAFESEQEARLDAQDKERLALEALDSERKAKEREASAREDADCRRLEAVDARNKEQAAKALEAAARRKAEEEQQKAIAQRDLARKYLARAQEAVDKLTKISEGDEFLANEPRLELVRKKLLHEALEYHKTFLEEQSDDPTVRRATATAFHNSASLHEDLGEGLEAEKMYRRALALREQLAAEFPATSAYRQQLAQSCNGLAELLAKRGRAEAEKLHRQALAIREQLVADFPAANGYRFDLAVSCNNLAVLLRARGDGAEAEKLWGRALELFDGLAAEFPTNRGYNQLLATTCSNLAFFHKARGEYGEAEKLSRRALAIREKLVAQYSVVPVYRQELAKSCNNLGELLRAKGENAEAEKLHRRALALRERLVFDFPATPIYRYDLALSCNNLALALKDIRQWEEAETLFRRALELREELAVAFPGIPAYRHELAQGCHNLAQLLAVRGQRAEAEYLSTRAVDLLQELVAEFPAQAEFRRYQPLFCAQLTNILLGQCEAELTQGRTVDAACSAGKLLTVSLVPARLWLGGAVGLARCAKAAATDLRLSDAERPHFIKACTDLAVEMLQRADKEGFKMSAAGLRSNAEWAPLRNHPGFQALLAKLDGKSPK